MVSLDQVRQLEAKVNRAVEIIRVLREENRALQRSVAASQARMKELEEFVRVFKSEQAEIENGLVSAIRKLDQLEDGLEAARRSEARGASGDDARAAAVADRALEASQTGADGRPGQLDIF
jgi:FtsZ-binding cell division protein ZapB